MTDLASPVRPGQPPAPRGLLSRLIGVLTAPRAAYGEIVARPRAAGALALVAALVAAPSAVFFSTDVGRRALLDQQVRTLESFGVRIPDEAYDRMEERLAQPTTPLLTAASQMVTIPLFAVVIAAVGLLVFNVVLGGDATFKQALAVVAHAGVITVVQQLFALPLDYVRESLASPTALAVFFPFLDETSFAARLLGSIDLFVLWWIVNLATGFGVLYKRPTGPMAASFIGVYAGLALVLAALRMALSGS